MKNSMINFANKVLGKEPKILELNLKYIEDAAFNKDPDLAYFILKTIYDNVLKDDENWHLFYEGYWLSQLRVSEPFYNEVKKYLDFYDVEYEEKGEWLDDNELVQEHKHIFRPLFHQFSEIGMLEYYDGTNYYGKGGAFELLDRVLHCFLNHQYYALRDFVDKHSAIWEPKLLMDNALLRMRYMGRCDGVHEGYTAAAKYFLENEEDEEEASEE